MSIRFASAVALGFASLLLIPAATASDKSRYDIREPVTGHDDSPASISATTGLSWKLIRDAGEIAVSTGGFFTIGTTAGLSSKALDDRCGITFGHPYARTSYPVICIDGNWAKPEGVFLLENEVVVGGGDSIVLSYSVVKLASLTLLFRISSDGGAYTVQSRITNLDSVSHTFGLGYAIDPALGVRGDGFLFVGGTAIQRDTVILAPAASPVLIHERSTIPAGLQVSVDYPDVPPDKIIAANWSDRADIDEPVYTASAVRQLYDLDLFFSWEPVPVAGGSSLTRSIRMTQLTPDFGPGVFLRWDLPDHGAVNDGLAFPVSFQSTVTATNLGSVVKTGTLSVSAGPEITFDTTSRPLSIGVSGTMYGHARATVEEFYQETVVRLVAAFRESGGTGDSVIHYYYVPATPVSDTGLVVRIDSVGTGGYPDVTAFIEVQRQATLQYVYTLAPKNVVLTDNGVPVTPSSIGRDTVGGLARSDIVFVLDVTGSMSGAINGVKNNIIAFTDSLAARGMAYRLGMVTFLDAVENVYPFTTSASDFKNSVSAQYAHEGGDGPENSLDALDSACTLPWDPLSRHVVIWITDNAYHETDWATFRTRQQVIAHLLETNILVYAIGSVSYQTDWYNPIINATGGKFYDYLGNFRDILVDIGLSNTSRRIMISYKAPASGPTLHTIAVTVHYAGLGGGAVSTYTAPGGMATGKAGLVNYPNPFNPRTTLRLESPGRSAAYVTVCDYLGRELRRIQLPLGDGVREVVWDARDERGFDVATGVYFARAVFVSSAGECIGSAVAKILYLR
jgi:Mg-chelatase subunit ChlD